jgi:hypothetical protein
MGCRILYVGVGSLQRIFSLCLVKPNTRWSTTPPFQSKAPAGSDEAATATARGNTTKKRARRVRAREEKYWAEKEKEKEPEETADAEGEGEREGEGEEDPAALMEAVARGGGPLSSELLERVARAKEAERARKIHEALAVVEMARCGGGGGRRKDDWVGLMVYGVLSDRLVD